MTDTHDPGFYDLFVSYSTKDNVAPDPLASAGEREGWVQVFIKRVRALSADFTGEPLTTTDNAEPDWDAFYAPDDIHVRLRAALASTPGQTAGALESAQQRETDLPGYTHALAATLRFTFDRLAHEHPAAATVLHYAAHFPAEAVPLPWLRVLASQQHPELLEEADTPGSLSAWDRVELRLSESLRLLTHTDGEHESIARLHRLAGEFLRLSAQQAGEDAARVAAVEGFIEQRCTLAEHDHHSPLAPWERTVLLADLMTRMARKDCTNLMAQNGLLLGQILTAYADLGTARRLYVAANAVMQRLAESDPANAAWQRDLSVSHHKLAMFAQQSGDDAGCEAEMRECFRVLDQMKQRGLHFDPQMAQVYQQLAGMFGG